MQFFDQHLYLKIYIYVLSIPVSLWIVVGLKSSLVTVGVMQIHKLNSDKWMARAREKETSDIYRSTHTANDASVCLRYRGLTIIIYILSYI